MGNTTRLIPTPSQTSASSTLRPYPTPYIFYSTGIGSSGTEVWSLAWPNTSSASRASRRRSARRTTTTRRASRMTFFSAQKRRYGSPTTPPRFRRSLGYFRRRDDVLQAGDQGEPFRRRIPELLSAPELPAAGRVHFPPEPRQPVLSRPLHVCLPP